MYWVKTTARGDKTHSCLGVGVSYIRGFTILSLVEDIEEYHLSNWNWAMQFHYTTYFKVQDKINIKIYITSPLPENMVRCARIRLLLPDASSIGAISVWVWYISMNLCTGLCSETVWQVDFQHRTTDVQKRLRWEVIIMSLYITEAT